MLPSGKPWGLTDSASAGYASLARAVRRARSAGLFREHFGRANLSSLVSGVGSVPGLVCRAGAVALDACEARPVRLLAQIFAAETEKISWNLRNCDYNAALFCRSVT